VRDLPLSRTAPKHATTPLACRTSATGARRLCRLPSGMEGAKVHHCCQHHAAGSPPWPPWEPPGSRRTPVSFPRSADPTENRPPPSAYVVPTISGD
jgi:hypothetical protein